MAVPPAQSNPRHSHINRDQIHRQSPLQTQLYTRAFLRMMKAMTSPPDHTRSSDARLALILSLIGLALSAAFAIASPQGLHHFDDLTHYLYARWAWTWPGYLLDHWGRPGFTVLYFPAAGMGWTACRLLSATLSAITAGLTFLLARQMNLNRPWLAVLALWIQPLFFALAQTTLTETPLAFYLTLALLLASRGRWAMSSAVLSVALVTRHEAVLFLPIWLYFARRAGAPIVRLIPVLWAPVVVNVAAWHFGMTTIIELYLRPKPSSQYGSDTFVAFLARSLHAFGPAVSALAFAGVLSVGYGIFSRRRKGTLQSDRTSPAVRDAIGDAENGRKSTTFSLCPLATTVLVASCLTAYIAAQTVIRMFGLFDSGGYARFLVPVGPCAALMATLTWNAVTSESFDLRRRFAMLTALAMTILWISLEVQLRLHGGIDMELALLKQAVIAVRVITPLTILAALGSAFDFARPLGLIAPKALPVTLILIAAVTGFTFMRPLTPPPEAAIIDEARAALAARGLGDRSIISAVVWLNFIQNRASMPEEPSVRKRIEDAPIGTLFAWERQFAGSPDHKLRLSEFQNSHAFRQVLVTRPRPFTSEPYLYVFEKVATWGPHSAQELP